MIKIQICSYVWKSIWAAKVILAKGLCLRVGTGTNISINDDAGIPDAVNFRLSIATNSMRDFKVNELIDSNNRLWKRELINSTFTEEDASSNENLRAYVLQTIYRKFYKKTLEPESTNKNKDYNLEAIMELFAYKGEYAVRNGLPGCLSSLTLVKVAFSAANFGPYREIEIEEYTRKKSVMKKKLQTSSINFDGAYNESQTRSASGIVARDAEGKVLLSCSEIHNDITFAFAAEAIACWKVVQIGVEKEWLSIIFEGDSLAIIKKCNTKGQDRSL
ncbi:hypothetical protein Golob_024818, partial [Gossypium lobatum]|nr:hypothetical protein [Gossypium lobatum]